MPSERSSLDASSRSNKRKRDNYEEQFYRQIDNLISNGNNNSIIDISSKKNHSQDAIGGDDPMSQIILQDRRHRNLLASKKYRAKKQKLEREKDELIQTLSNDNQSLKQRVQELEFENKSLKEIMNKLTTSSAASVLDNTNKVMTVRERLCRKGN